MAFDPYAPYGPVKETTLRIATWNVWGRFGDIDQRQADIEDELAAAQPDIVCLVEAWGTDDATQPDVIATRLGFDHAHFEPGLPQEGWNSGLGIVSRWPVTSTEHRRLPGVKEGDLGLALAASIDGERGPIEMFVAMLDYPLNGSATRQAQVTQLCELVNERASMWHPAIICGDFNAGPETDEIRMLTGTRATAVDGLVFYDAWELAGDGSPGYTWSNANPLAAIGLYPNRRFDYVLSAWPRAHGVGHPVRCERLGVRPSDQPQLSDHYGVVADLRY